MSSVKHKVPRVKCQCQVPSVKCQVCSIKCQASSVKCKCQVSSVKCQVQVSSVKCQVSSGKCQVPSAKSRIVKSSIKKSRLVLEARYLEKLLSLSFAVVPDNFSNLVKIFGVNENVVTLEIGKSNRESGCKK